MSPCPLSGVLRTDAIERPSLTPRQEARNAPRPAASRETRDDAVEDYLAVVDEAAADSLLSRASSPSLGNLSASLVADAWKEIAPQEKQGGAAGGKGGGGEIKTGNKPSTFNYRVNPWFRYTSLKNDVEIFDYTLFLMVPVKWPIGTEGAFVMEGPIVQHQDFTDASTLPPAARTEGTGLADLIIRMPMIWDPWILGSFRVVPLFLPEFTLPLGSDEVSGNTFIASPGAGVVISSLHSRRWWVALVHFYDIDLHKSDGSSDVERFRLRYFLQITLTKSPPIFYILPEFQAVWDFETGEQNFWFAPEFGWVVKPIKPGHAGVVVYFKPGFGVGAKSDSFDRDVTFEIGIRWMWDEFPLK